MIVFDLICAEDHVFEAWFGSSADYEGQKQSGLLSCPLCGSHDVSKAIMAPNVGRKGNQMLTPPQKIENTNDDGPKERLATAQAKEMTELLSKMRAHIQQNFDYVGPKFAEEARKIHYGESDSRAIYGEANLEETQELLEEGVDILPLPGPTMPRKTDA